MFYGEEEEEAEGEVMGTVSDMQNVIRILHFLKQVNLKA